MDKFLLKKVPTCCGNLYYENCKLKKSTINVEVQNNEPLKILEGENDCMKQDQVPYNLITCSHTWRHISAEHLALDYTRIFSRIVADDILKNLEAEVEYFTGDLLKVKVFNKWHTIPRKQVAYGDNGLSYTFSKTTVPAVPWNKCKIIMELKKVVESATGHSFNFVLVNRYKDGEDHMGEHRDDEKDLVSIAPIASLSFGQSRDFIFKHRDARGKDCKLKIDPVKMELEHGSLLLMKYPTNHFWYHSLPKRKNAKHVRVNLTFRQMIKQKTNH